MSFQLHVGHPGHTLTWLMKGGSSMVSAVMKPAKNYYLDSLEFGGSVDHTQFVAAKDQPHKPQDLFFNDGNRRIDFILAWSTEVSKKSQQASEARMIFENNLKEEGLQLEYDLTNHHVNYVKIHAPYELLKRYADILKLRMPIKAARLTTGTKAGQKDSLVRLKYKLLKPLQYDRKKLPPITRSYTCPYSSNKEYLFEIPENPEDLFSNATRSWIVDYILRRKYFTDTTENSFACGINMMISDNIYTAAYPLHEGNWKGSVENPRKILFDNWASWRNCFKLQPIDHIRVYVGETIILFIALYTLLVYFGETIALYFAWLGFYTSMLIPATFMGIAVFILSLYVMFTDNTSKELCDPKNNITMCPLCDDQCGYWKLNIACFHTKVSRIFDNWSTVYFAVFMSLWGTFFLEFWKRKQAQIQYKWDLTTFVEEEQPPRPEYLSKLENWKTMKVNPVTGMREPHLPFWRMRFPRYFTSYSIMLLMTILALAVLVAVIAYKVSLFAALNLVTTPIMSASSLKLIQDNASFVTATITAIINLIIIMILNCVCLHIYMGCSENNFCLDREKKAKTSVIYGYLAFWLTDWEYLRTQSDYDNSITLKLFVFQFISCFSSIYYIAFFKGQFTGGPGKYRTLFGSRTEECDPAGCLIELCIQLAIILVGRQIVQNNLKETVIPKIVKFIKMRLLMKTQEQKLAVPVWETEYLLEPTSAMALFYEYLEMVMQFGFLTIFCAAFPLGPMFALLNNIMEIRVDANKFVTELQRPVAFKSASIGVWYSVLYIISRIAIVTNALIIASTSEFIPRLVYVIGYSKDGSLNGYINFTLSYFNTSDFAPHHKPKDVSHGNVQICRYKDFRNPPWGEDPYNISAAYWHVLAARLAFVCVFENVVVVVTSLLSWLIPDIPTDLREQIRREAYVTNEIVLATELKRARGEPLTEKNVVVVVASILSWPIPDIPSDLSEQIRRETFVSSEIIPATELKRASGGTLSDSAIPSDTELESSEQFSEEFDSSAASP